MDFVAYIAIGLTFGRLCIVFAEYNINAKWLILVFQTSLVFGYAVSTQRRVWKYPAFWAVCVAALVLHLLLAIALLQNVVQFRPVWVATSFPLETSFVMVLLDLLIPKFLKLKPRSFRHSSKPMYR